MHQDFFKDLGLIDLVALEINSSQARALKETSKIVNSISTDSVSLKVKTVKIVQISDTLDRADQVVRKVEVRKHRQVVKTFHLLDAVLVNIQATKLGVVIKAADLTQAIAFEVKSL